MGLGPAFDEFRNPNGTYDGVALMARLSGLSSAEVRWTFERLKALFAEGWTREEAKAIVAEEARARPWERG